MEKYSSCVCVFAFHVPTTMKTHEIENKHELKINVQISTGAISYNPMTPSKNLCLYYPSSCTKTFEYPYAWFLSNERGIAYTIIQSANLLFPLENNIHWGVKYPAADDTDSKLENLDKTVDRILEVARSCGQKKGNMEIRISKLEKLPLKEYEKKETMLSTYRGLKGKKPLDDWIMENKDELGFATCYEFIYKELASKRRYFGLESVKARSGISGCCSICRKEMIQGVQVIRMPCSHTFHGICIFQWLARKPTCPLCRSVLMDQQHYTTTDHPLIN